MAETVDGDVGTGWWCWICGGVGVAATVDGGARCMAGIV